MREITEFPAADVAPVRHGKWECLDAEIGLFLCSTCKCKILLTKATYCPNCGAPMTDEAVEMVMEKINNMEEMTNEH